MNRQNYTNFKRNLAMMVDGNVDGQTDGQTTDKKWTNERTELHQFQKEPSYDGDLCPCQV